MVKQNEGVKNIAILGSTGSIGTQALEVVRDFPDRYRVKVLTTRRNAALLIRQAQEFLPDVVAIADKDKYREVKNALTSKGIDVLAGKEGITEAVHHAGTEMVLMALVGYSALEPTIEAIRAGKDIALASKEVMVIAGGIIQSIASKKNVRILPVDSEHSAIFQCLEGESPNQVEKVYLTASGGPFLHYTHNELKKVTPERALKHPNWNMGDKITVDSASLMNKGLEVIEAKWLFHLDPAQIEVVVHPQSVIHSMVQFRDGALKAQMGTPDMRLPILYSFSFPERLQTRWPRFDFGKYPLLTFEKADPKKFRNLALSFEALRKGGNMPCVLNAANEIAVRAFLQKKLEFLAMPEIIEKTMQKIDFIENPDLEDLKLCDIQARQFATALI